MNPVTRLRFTSFSPQRLKRRTDGWVGWVETQTPLKFMLAGLGSIGSNLLVYLNSLNVSDYILVDPDMFQLENVERHLLSFNEVGMKKVDAIGKYLIFNNPFLNIKKYAVSVSEVIRRHLLEINRMDFIFCAIGKDAIESYILKCLASGQITRPVVLFWVEPYLLGAHVLYIRPSTAFNLKSVETDGFYNFNIIAKETYQDSRNQLVLREAGCQSSYVPYGKEAITCFFAKVWPCLYELIKCPPQENLAYTYAGDLTLAIQLGLKTSDYSKKLTSRQLHKHTL